MQYSPFLDEFGGLGSPAGGMNPMTLAGLMNNQPPGGLPLSWAPTIPMPTLPVRGSTGSPVPGGLGPQPPNNTPSSLFGNLLGGGGKGGGGLGGFLGGGDRGPRGLY